MYRLFGGLVRWYNTHVVSKPFTFGKLEEMRDDGDLEYWSRQSDEQKFHEAWRLVELAHQIKGLSKDELRFSRSVGSLQRWGR